MSITGGDNLIVGVLVEITNKSVDRVFDYLVPKNLEDKIEQFSSNISTLIDEENQKLFKKFIGSIDKQNRVISEIADDEVKIEHWFNKRII